MTAEWKAARGTKEDLRVYSRRQAEAEGKVAQYRYSDTTYRGFRAYLIMYTQVVQVKTWSKKVSVGEDRQDWHSAGFSTMTQEEEEEERKLGH